MKVQAVPLKHLCRAIDERAGGTDAPLLSVSIHLGVVPRSDLTEDLSRAEDLSNYKICEPGDLVINRMRAFQGAIGLSGHLGLVSPDYIVLRPIDPASGPFLHYLVRSRWFVSEMASRLRGIGAVDQGNVRTPRINAEDLGEIEISLPSTGERVAIVRFLDAETARIDALVEAKHRSKALVEERFWTETDSEIWTGPTVRLSYSARSWCDGPFGSSLASEHYSDTGARVIRLSNIGRGVFRGDNEAFIPHSYFLELTRHEVQAGDLLIAGLGDDNQPLARACVAPVDLGPALVKADCFRVTLDTAKLDPGFAAWALSSPSGESRSAELARGTTRSRANLGMVIGLAIPRPDIARQRSLATEIDIARAHADATRDALTRQITLLRERKQALITAAVTGQLDIPGTAA